MAGRADDSENEIELIEVVFAGEKRPIVEHLSENATHGPDVDGLCVALGVEHDLGGSVPSDIEETV